MEERGLVRTDPYFFRMIAVSAFVVVAIVLIGALFYQAPLQEAAELHNVPNPSKSAWFLLWMQEVVSYHAYFIYAIFGLFVFFLALPFFVKNAPTHARWFANGYVTIYTVSIVAFLTIVGLTIFAYYFRGEYWAVVFF